MRYNILSVDEFGITRIELVNMLKKLNIQVHGVKDEYEAINVLFENKIRVSAIVWTINSLDLSAFDAIKRIKAKDAYKSIPIIIVSKFTDKRYIIKAIESGAAEYIAKPYDEKTVIRKFCNILGIRPEEADEKKEQEDIVTFNYIEMLSREVKSASRGSHALSLMLVSVIKDDDTGEGEDKSNEIIELVNKVLRTKLRETDISFLYGANNIIVLLPFANRDGVKVVDKKLKNIFETHSLIKQKNKGYTLVSSSVSFPEDGKIKDKLLEKLEQNFNGRLNEIKTDKQ